MQLTAGWLDCETLQTGTRTFIGRKMLVTSQSCWGSSKKMRLDS